MYESDYGLFVLKFWPCHLPWSYNFSLLKIFTLCSKKQILVISHASNFQWILRFIINVTCWIVLLGIVFPRILFSVWFWVELAKSEVVRDSGSRNEAGTMMGSRSTMRRDDKSQPRCASGLQCPHSPRLCIQLSLLPGTLPRAAPPGQPADAVNTQRCVMKISDSSLDFSSSSPTPPHPTPAAGRAWAPDFPVTRAG